MMQLVFGFLAIIAALELTQPQPTPEQLKLIQKLGDHDFRTREAAHKELADMGVKARIALERHGLMSEEPEIHARVERLIGRVYYVKTTNDEYPYIYGLYKLKVENLPSGKTWKTPKGMTWKYYQKVEGDFSTFDTDKFYRATGHFKNDLIRQGWDKEDIRAILEAMLANQDNWQYTDMDTDSKADCDDEDEWIYQGGPARRYCYDKK